MWIVPKTLSHFVPDTEGSTPIAWQWSRPPNRRISMENTLGENE